MIRLMVLLCVFYTLPAALAFGVFTYDATNSRDPFEPLVGASAAASKGVSKGINSIGDIVLQGIIMESESTGSAILNGEVVKVGEKIGNVTVEEVKPNRVIIDINGEKHELALYEE